MEQWSRLHRTPRIYRSSPRITPEPTGHLKDRRSPIGRPRGIGSIANFNIPKCPRRPNYRENSPSAGSARSGRYRAGSEPYPERRVLESCRANCTITATMRPPNSRLQHGKPMIERTRTSWYIQQKGYLFITIIGEGNTEQSYNRIKAIQPMYNNAST